MGFQNLQVVQTELSVWTENLNANGIIEKYYRDLFEKGRSERVPRKSVRPIKLLARGPWEGKGGGKGGGRGTRPPRRTYPELWGQFQKITLRRPFGPPSFGQQIHMEKQVTES